MFFYFDISHIMIDIPKVNGINNKINTKGKNGKTKKTNT